MVHIILDQKNNKGLINITGDKEEVRTDFANFFEKLYEAAPDMFLELLDILNLFTIHLQEEELKKMIRTILVTKVENKITKERKEIYGRYDAVKLQKEGYKIVDTLKRKYTMSDTDFALHAKVVDA